MPIEATILQRLRNHDRTLIGLDFSKSSSRLDATDIQTLAILLAKNETLITLDLGQSVINEACGQALATALAQNQTLLTLRINLPYTYSQSQHIRVTYGLSEAGAQALAEGLAQNRKLTTLELQNNPLGDAGAQSLITAILIQNQTLRVLDLSGCQLSGAAIQTLAGALRMNQRLTSLNLEMNQVGDVGAKALADSLSINQTLVSLDLGQNELKDEGAQALATMLMRNRTLSTLRLDSNQIGKIGIQSLAHALAQNQTLTKLNLANNQLDNSITEALALMLVQNQALISLGLNQNKLDDMGMQVLGNALEQNHTLTLLDLTQNSSRGGYAKFIDPHLERNQLSQLQKLNTAYSAAQSALRQQQYAQAIQYFEQALQIRATFPDGTDFRSKNRGRFTLDRGRGRAVFLGRTSSQEVIDAKILKEGLQDAQKKLQMANVSFYESAPEKNIVTQPTTLISEADDEDIYRLIRQLEARIKNLEADMLLKQSKIDTLQNQVGRLNERCSRLEETCDKQQQIIQTFQSPLKNTLFFTQAPEPTQEDTVIKVQSLFRGVRIRKQKLLDQLSEIRQAAIKEKTPQVMAQLAQAGKFNDIDKLSKAIKERSWHTAMQIIRDIPEKDFPEFNRPDRVLTY